MLPLNSLYQPPSTTLNKFQTFNGRSYCQNIAKKVNKRCQVKTISLGRPDWADSSRSRHGFTPVKNETALHGTTSLSKRSLALSCQKVTEPPHLLIDCRRPNKGEGADAQWGARNFPMIFSFFSFITIAVSCHRDFFIVFYCFVLRFLCHVRASFSAEQFSSFSQIIIFDVIIIWINVIRL